MTDDKTLITAAKNLLCELPKGRVAALPTLSGYSYGGGIVVSFDDNTIQVQTLPLAHALADAHDMIQGLLSIVERERTS